MTGKQLQINIVEVKRPELDAQLVAENIAFQLERRISFRRAMRQAQQRAMRFGAKGIKMRVSGRLNGAEIARTEWTPEGRFPFIPCGRISIMGLRKRRRRTAKSA